jgi:hypothetical protein
MKVLEFSEDHDTVDRLYLGGGIVYGFCYLKKLTYARVRNTAVLLACVIKTDRPAGVKVSKLDALLEDLEQV